MDTCAVADAVSILAEYLKDAPWLKLLCDHFKNPLTLLKLFRLCKHFGHFSLQFMQSLEAQKSSRAMLCRLNLLEATTKPSDLEISPVAIESKAGSNLSQGRINGGGKITRNVKQSKKAKLETESWNIKEMFTRASRRKG
ncbi:hypothetical protein SLA2020_457350 [Shorea laevis]